MSNFYQLKNSQTTDWQMRDKFLFLFFNFLKGFIYLFMRDTEREREREAETQAEGDTGSKQGA